MRYRLTKLRVTVIREGAPPPRILSSPEDVVRLATEFANLEDDDREHFWAVCLDAKNRYLGHFEISAGGTSETPVDPKVVFRQALVAGAVHLILVHNHPSGDPTPSRADRALTRDLAEGAKLLGLGLHDHLIVGSGTGRWVSLAQQGGIQDMRE